MNKLVLCLCVLMLAACARTPGNIRLSDLRSPQYLRDVRRVPLDFAKIQMALFKHERKCGAAPVFAVEPDDPSYATITLKEFPGAKWGDTVLVDLTLLENFTVRARTYTYRPNQDRRIEQVFAAISHPDVCPGSHAGGRDDDGRDGGGQAGDKPS